MTKDEILQGIIEFRKLEGMSQAQAARNYGCGPSHWCDVESGRRPASIEGLAKMADAVGMKLEIDLTVK